MGKAICKELGKTSAIVLAGRNPAKLETAKAELDELGVESDLCKTDIAARAQVQALADYAASLGSVKQIIHTSGVSPCYTATEYIIKNNAAGTVNMVEAFYPALTEGGVMINFSSVAAYTMPQTDEWTQAFEAWNEPDFYDRLLALAYRRMDVSPTLTDALYDLSRAGSFAAMRELVSRFPMDENERAWIIQMLRENGQTE